MRDHVVPGDPRRRRSARRVSRPRARALGQRTMKLTWVMAPITEHDLAAAAAEAHKVAQEVRQRFDDEDVREIRALELDGLTRKQLLQRLTKLAAEMDRLANDDDPTAGTLAEWAPATRVMFGKLTKPDLIGAVLEHEELVEPVAAYRRWLLEELALRLAMDPRGGPVFRDRTDFKKLPSVERDAIMDGVAQELSKFWWTEAGSMLNRWYSSTMPRPFETTVKAEVLQPVEQRLEFPQNSRRRRWGGEVASPRPLARLPSLG